MTKTSKNLTRRQFGKTLGALSMSAPLLSPAILRAQATIGTETEAPQFVTSSFVSKRWERVG